jgi:hypothetical protein
MSGHGARDMTLASIARAGHAKLTQTAQRSQPISLWGWLDL